MASADRCDECRDSPRPCGICHEALEVRARASWDAYCRSGQKPRHVPDRPDVVYQDAWSGWQDWLTWVGVPTGRGPSPASVEPWAEIPDIEEDTSVLEIVPVAGG